MSYTKREDVPAPDGWVVVEFADGSLVRVRCERKAVEKGVCYHAQAQAVTAKGVPMRDASGRWIATEHKRTVPVSAVEQLGDSSIIGAALRLVMGEPTDLFPVPESIRHSPMTNVQARIKAAAVSGTADAGAAL